MPETIPQTFTIPGLTMTGPLRPIGEGDDPNVRLLGRLDLLGASFHVEADQVHQVSADEAPDPEGWFQMTIGPADESHYDQMAEMAAGGPFEVIEIPGLPGRRFVLYIYPFCT